MTQLSIVEAGQQHARRRKSDERIYGMLYVLLFPPVIALVAIGHLLPTSWRRSRYRTRARDERSLMAEAKGEVESALALLFMV